VFELSSKGHETVLYKFAGNGNKGAGPYGGVIMDAKGNLYGTAYYGGDLSCADGIDGSGCGTVFKLTP
jgi:uncharacterized repeat protein (TIGR03803 family)